MNAPADIRMIVFDIDGVLTDGSIYVDDRGIETRRFHVRDGLGIKLAQQAGLLVGVISGRAARSATLRLTGLGISLIMQGQADKAQSLRLLCRQAGVAPEQTAYLGDDLIDLPAMHLCAYPMAVADAVSAVRAVAQFIAPSPGGRGAVREAVEHLLQAQGKWDGILQRYHGMDASSQA